MKQLITLALIFWLVSPLMAQKGCGCGFDLTERVTDAYGRSVSGAYVGFTGCWNVPCGAEDWQTRYVLTNAFGYFTIKGVLPLDYGVEIRHRRYVPKVMFFSAYDVPADAFVVWR